MSSIEGVASGIREAVQGLPAAGALGEVHLDRAAEIIGGLADESEVLQGVAADLARARTLANQAQGSLAVVREEAANFLAGIGVADTGVTTEGGAQEAPREVPPPVDPVVGAVGAMFAPPALPAAVARGRLRLDPSLVDGDPGAAERSAGYEACVQAYEELADAYNRAKGQLMQAMGDPDPIPKRRGEEQYISWHVCDQEYPDGQRVTLAYEVIVTMKDGVFTAGYDSVPNAPIVVRTHPVQKPTRRYSGMESRHFTGVLTGHVLFDADALEASIREDELQLPSFKQIAGAAVEKLEAEARREAVEKWVDAYLAVPGPRGDKIGEGAFGFRYNGNALKVLLGGGTGHRDTARQTLAAVFSDKNFDELYHLLDQPMPRLLADLERYGVHDRYAWLLQNAGQIRRDVLENVRHAITFGFQGLATARVEAEAEKVKRLFALAAMLRKTNNINHSAPEKRDPSF